MAMPDAPDGRAAVLLSGAGNGNLGNARIHSEKTFDTGGFRLAGMARGGEVENALVENQVGFAPPGLQQFCLARASFKRDLQAAFDGPDRNHLPARIPRQDTVVERNRSARPERSFYLI